MKLVFDFDGVLRNTLLPIVGGEPDKWDWTKDGLNIYEIVKRNPSILLEAPPTKYLSIISKYITHLKVFTGQPTWWKTSTHAWLHAHVTMPFDVVFVGDIGAKLGYLDDDMLLVDDYPFYDDYTQIAVVDCKYNQNVQSCYRRLHTVDDMEKLFVEVQDA